MQVDGKDDWSAEEPRSHSAMYLTNISLNKLSGHSLNLSLSVCLAVYTKFNHTTHKHSASSAQPLEPCTFTGISPHFSPEDPAYTGKI